MAQACQHGIPFKLISLGERVGILFWVESSFRISSQGRGSQIIFHRPSGVCESICGSLTANVALVLLKWLSREKTWETPPLQYFIVPTALHRHTLGNRILSRTRWTLDLLRILLRIQCKDVLLDFFPHLNPFFNIRFSIVFFSH